MRISRNNSINLSGIKQVTLRAVTPLQHHLPARTALYIWLFITGFRNYRLWILVIQKDFILMWPLANTNMNQIIRGTRFKFSSVYKPIWLVNFCIYLYMYTRKNRSIQSKRPLIYTHVIPRFCYCSCLIWTDIYSI